MEFLKKFLEVVNFSKDHWIVILSCLILSGSIGGNLWIKSKDSEISARDTIIDGLRRELEDYKNGKSGKIENMKVKIEGYEYTVFKQTIWLLKYKNEHGPIPEPSTVELQNARMKLNRKNIAESLAKSNF